MCSGFNCSVNGHFEFVLFGFVFFLFTFRCSILLCEMKFSYSLVLFSISCLLIKAFGITEYLPSYLPKISFFLSNGTFLFSFVIRLLVGALLREDRFWKTFQDRFWKTFQHFNFDSSYSRTFPILYLPDEIKHYQAGFCKGRCFAKLFINSLL